MELQSIKELSEDVVNESREEFKELIRGWIKQGLKEHLTSSYSSPFVYAFRGIMEDVFTDEYKAQVASEIKTELEAHKPQLLALSRKAMEAHIISLHEGLLKEFLRVMTDDYHREVFFNKIFGNAQ